jgi:coproporphyrinogen III oxidase-like Fe-S oxidoreductase
MLKFPWKPIRPRWKPSALRDYRAAGVNRVSLGVQSLHDEDLKLLGRLHDAATARRAIETARATFPRLSFDLIYARPNQTLAQWEAELKDAIALAADHLSLYQLTIEEGTPFYTLYHAGKLTMPDQDLGAEFYELTQKVTEAEGLPAYECPTTPTRRRMPSQSRLLALWRLCGRWSGRPWPFIRRSEPDGDVRRAPP